MKLFLDWLFWRDPVRVFAGTLNLLNLGEAETTSPSLLAGIKAMGSRGTKYGFCEKRRNTHFETHNEWS